MKLEPIPETLTEAIGRLVDDPEIKSALEENPEALNESHHSFGRAVRNNWGLWNPESPLVAEFKKKFKLFGHADDISGLIFNEATRLITDKGETMEQVTDGYRKHWQRSNVDPETGKELNVVRKPNE